MSSVCAAVFRGPSLKLSSTLYSRQSPRRTYPLVERARYKTPITAETRIVVKDESVELLFQSRLLNDILSSAMRAAYLKSDFFFISTMTVGKVEAPPKLNMMEPKAPTASDSATEGK